MESSAPARPILAQISTRRTEGETKLAALGFLKIPHEHRWDQPAALPTAPPLQRDVSLGVGVGPAQCQTVALHGGKLDFS